MVEHIEEGQTWTYEPPVGGHANLNFASASAKVSTGAIRITRNGDEVDFVYLRVPHSWWMPSQAFGAQTFIAGDVLEVSALYSDVAFRIDLDEHRPED